MEYLEQDKEINRIDPIVSVCVPAYQHAKYIAECLDNVLSQETDFPFEILIGEDDSQDGTREICISYADKYPEKIRLFLRDGSKKIKLYGKTSGRLNHLALYQSARGKYVSICDGDDYWTDKNKLQAQFNALEENPDAVFCITDTFIDGEGENRPRGLPDDFKIFESKELSRLLYFGHISSWMMRNHMAELLKSPITMKPIAVDNIVFNFYKLRGKTIFLPQKTSVYRFNPNGLFRGQDSKSNHKKNFMHNWYLFYYLHKDPVQLLRSMTYAARRYIKQYI